jgi:hypothetical protein
MRARKGGYARWSRVADPAAAIQPARRGFRARFERQVDPDGVLEPAERTRRTEAAISAYMTGLALRSSRVRGRKACGEEPGETSDRRATQERGGGVTAT